MNHRVVDFLRRPEAVDNNLKKKVAKSVRNRARVRACWPAGGRGGGGGIPKEKILGKNGRKLFFAFVRTSIELTRRQDKCRCWVSLFLCRDAAGHVNLRRQQIQMTINRRDEL
jgi:hypothetical protein